MKKKYTLTLLTVIAALIGFAINAAASTGYMTGDFHQHTLYTDGSNPFFKVMAKNAEYNLDWWANSEHGGSRNRDGFGHNWLDATYYPISPILGDNPEAGYMYRWQGIRDFVFKDVLATRMVYPNKTIINGFEWNVPGHEHCSTAIYQYDNTANLISEFEYRFDGGDKDTSRNGQASQLPGFALLEKTNSTKEDAVSACAFMQTLVEQGLGDAWVVPAHIERVSSYTIADFRNWNNAGPDVAFGFEGAPGHQTSGDRGFGRNADGGGTYGGTGYYCAQVGGLWDAMLAEGRNWWMFASSDFHNHWSDGGSDFWPGEYQKDYVAVETENLDLQQAIFNGVRSGNSFQVEGDLIDSLEFTAHSLNEESATMGQTLVVAKGEMVTLKIKVHDPVGTNHCPLNMMNPSLAQIGIYQPLNMPVLDHIDLISGDVTGYIMPEEADYNKETNESTSVIETFNTGHGRKTRNGFIKNLKDDRCSGNSTKTFIYRFKAENDCFFRLRGTNLPAGVPFETDQMGNPLADSLANDNLYAAMDNNELEQKLIDGIELKTNSKLDEVAEAYADLWFYSNPIFVQVVE